MKLTILENSINNDSNRELVLAFKITVGRVSPHVFFTRNKRDMFLVVYVCSFYHVAPELLVRFDKWVHRDIGYVTSIVIKYGK